MAEDKINTERGPRMVPPGCEPAGPGAVSAWVAGEPAPQGSKRPLGAGRPGGKIRMIESSKKLKPWRQRVVDAFTDDVAVLPLAGAVTVKIVFVCPRPKATPKTRATPPKVTKPDVDKLARAVLDALTLATVIQDDSFVVTLHAHKRLAELGEPTGAMIHVEPLRTPEDPARRCTATLGVLRLAVRCSLDLGHTGTHMCDTGLWWTKQDRPT